MAQDFGKKTDARRHSPRKTRGSAPDAPPHRRHRKMRKHPFDAHAQRPRTAARPFDRLRRKSVAVHARVQHEVRPQSRRKRKRFRRRRRGNEVVISRPQSVLVGQKRRQNKDVLSDSRRPQARPLFHRRDGKEQRVVGQRLRDRLGAVTVGIVLDDRDHRPGGTPRKQTEILTNAGKRYNGYGFLHTPILCAHRPHEFPAINAM